MKVSYVSRDNVVPAADDDGSFLNNVENLLQTASCTHMLKSLIRETTPQGHVIRLILQKCSDSVQEKMFAITVRQNSERLNEFQLLFYKAHCPGMIEFLGVHANGHRVVWDVPFESDVYTVSGARDYLQFRLVDDTRANFISLFCSVPGRLRFDAAAHYITRVVGSILMLGGFHMPQIYPSMIMVTDKISDEYLPNTDDEFSFLIRVHRLIRRSTRNLRLRRIFTPQHHCVGLILKSNVPADEPILTIYVNQNADGDNKILLMAYETPPAFFEFIGASPTEYRHVKYIPVHVDISGADLWYDIEVRCINDEEADFVMVSCNVLGRNEFDAAAHYMTLFITSILGLAEE